MANLCFIHGNEFRFDHRSGFEICDECELDNAAPKPRTEAFWDVYFEACTILKAAREAIEPVYNQPRLELWGLPYWVAAARRKDYALFFKAQNPKLLNVLFTMYDGQDPNSAIWKTVKRVQVAKQAA